ncbi:MAG TPA: hypothetical protein VHU84_11845 [Lacipirellulaceae bacterium]|nr:hypothetical protein [Lacipirellulaceae bacterium]
MTAVAQSAQLPGINVTARMGQRVADKFCRELCQAQPDLLLVVGDVQLFVTYTPESMVLVV